MTAISVTTEQTLSAEEGLQSWLTALESSSMNFHPRLFRMYSFFENIFFFLAKVDPVAEVQKCKAQPCSTC